MTGFNSKRDAAADKLQEPERKALKLALEVMQINLTLLEKVDPYEDQEDSLSDSLDLTHKAIATVKEALAQPHLPMQEPVKLWLWKNFVDGKPEYWAFDNPFPIFMDSHDPQTLGEPCGYAWLKPSRAGQTNVSDEQMLQDVQEALAQPVQEPVAWVWKDMRGQDIVSLFEPRFNSVPLYTAPPQRKWVGLTDADIADCMEMSIQKTCRAVETKLKERNS